MGAAQPRPQFVPDTEVDDRLRPLTVSELRKHKAPRWLVRSVMRRRTIVLVWGASQSGKTFIVLDLATAIARGVAWYGLRTSGGGVIYVAGEGHLAHRLDALMRERGIADEDLVGFRVVASSVNLLTAGADLLPLVKQLKAAAEEMGGVALVVLDTLNAMMPGGDENASEDMGAMIAAARLIATELDCTILFVHHCGKDEDRGARGHSSLRAAVDTELVVRNTGSCRTMKVEKQRDGEVGTEWAFKLRAIDLGPSDDPDAEEGERESSCVVEPMGSVPTAPARASKRDVALDALQAALSEHGQQMPGTSTIPPGTKAVQLDTWRSRFRHMTGDDYKSDDVAASAFRRERQKLLAAGKVACSGQHAWMVNP